MENSNNKNDTPEKGNDNTDQICNYFKHISTLCTGSILMIVTFHDKLTDQKNYKWCVPVSIIAFLICLGATFYLYSKLVFKKSESHILGAPKSGSDTFNLILGTAKLVSEYSFIVGIFLLVFYFVANSLSDF